MRSMWTANSEALIEDMAKKLCLTQTPPARPLRHQTSGGIVLFAVDHSPLMKDNSTLTLTHACRGRQSGMPSNRSSKYRLAKD